MGQVSPIDKAEREGDRHADRRHRKRGSTDAEHLLEIGLEADLEQQEHHAELGEQVDDLGSCPCGWNDTEHAATQNYSGHQLAQHSRLAEPLRQLAKELGGHQHSGQHQEQAGDGKVVHRGD